ncbi:MAG: PQQ-dependent sugar dehydrogenase [Verrucomicrobia bacterium]|nr:PQQ-dependent sugar dehydrogenase [Verrucomicrobiota bacterium]
MMKDQQLIGKPALLWAAVTGLAAMGSVYAENPAGTGLEAALAQTARLVVHPDLEVSLFACEPMVVNPANLDVDHRGRVWSTEGANYRLWQKWGKQRPEGDRIVILEDTDGDGQADSHKVFYQGDDVNTALGLCVLGSKVIVSRSPHVLVLTDTDGDDKADKKEILFSNIKGVDHDHGVHAFVFGPDGKLYFNQGNDGYQVGGPDGTIITDIFGRKVMGNRQPYQQGMVFRCDMDGSNFEVLGYNFRNNYEVAVDSFGTLWQSDNDDDGNQGVRINYVMQHGNYGYRDEMTGAGWGDKRTNMEEETPRRHWHLNDPGVVPNFIQTGAGSPTGILHYEGNLLPEVLRHQVIHCDAGPGVVRAYVRSDDGAGYKAGIVNVLQGGEDRWFRPSDVCAAPDGSLFISDWNDAGVGGHYMADQKLETMTGRIYRVAPKGHSYQVRPMDVSTVQGSMRALRSPNQERRYLAWNSLSQKGKSAEEALARLFRSGRVTAYRARAFHLLTRLDNGGDYIREAIQDPEKDIRITGIRAAVLKNADLEAILTSLTFDPSSQVRREVALALHQKKGGKIADIWADLASQHTGMDRWYLEALGIAASGNEDACFLAYAKKYPNRLHSEAGRDIIWRSRSAHAIPYVVEILQSNDIQQKEKDRFFRSLDFHSGPEKEEALLKLLAAE